MKKGLIIPVLGLALLGFVAFGTVRAYAENESGGYPPIIQKLVERFGLNEEEVKTVFDEVRTERQQEMQQSREERLNQAVSDGIITEEQKQALQNKWEEMRTERQQHREEMQAWFEEQGIDHEALMQYGGFGHRGFGRMGRMGIK